MLTDEGDISNYLGVNIKKNSYEIFKVLQSHLVEKFINHVVLEVFVSVKAKEALLGKPLLYKDESSLGRKCVWKYRSVVGMLTCIQGSA